MSNVLSKLQEVEWWQEKCLTDLYFLCRSILITLEDTSNGYKDMYYPTHKRICDFVQRYAYPGQKLLILTPRAWIKTYIITVGWYLQRMLRNLVAGNREIALISNATYDNSQNFLRRIKHNFKYNNLLRFLFEQWIPQEVETGSEEWTKDNFELQGNRIELGAVEKNLVSRHYYVMINDDLVNKENSQTAEQLAKTHDWWGLAHSLLHPYGIELNIGTRWHYEDNYGMIIEKFAKPVKEYMYDKPIHEWHSGNYHILHISCWSDPVARTGSTFPNMFPEEKLRELEQQLGERFYGQYENNPLNTGRNPFKREWIRRWNKNILPAVRYTMMLIDASGKAKSAESSATGISIVHLCPDKKMYVEYGQRHMISDRDLAEKIIELAMQYKPDTIGIEDVKYESIVELVELLIEQKYRTHPMKIGTDEEKDEAEYFKTIHRIIVELKPRGRPKPVRIKQLTGFFEQGQILLPFHGVEDLEEEIMKYPTIKDDVLDSLAYVLDLMVFPRITDPPKYLVVPDKLKMSTEAQIKDEWDNLKEECFADGVSMDGFADADLY